MREEDWIKQLRDKLEGHKVAAPDDLWAGIEAELDKQTAPKRHSRVVPLWVRWAVAAVFVGLLIGNYWLIHEIGQEKPGSNTIHKPMAASKPQQPVVPSEVPSEEEEPSLVEQMKDYPPMKSQDLVAQNQIPESVEPSESAEVVIVDEAKPSDDSNGSVNPEVPNSPLPPVLSQEEVIRQLDEKIAEASHPRHRIGFSLYAQNGFGSQMSINGVRMNPAMAENYNYDKYLPSATRTDSKDPIYLSNILERKKFYQPISFGLTTNIPISSKFSLITGLVYTRLRSDFVSVVSDYPLEKHQTLQYLGVPFSAQYLLLDYKGLKLYVSAGGQADYNLKACQTTEGVEQKIRRDRWQFSVQGALGVQYDVIPQLGIYVEPGVKRYFNNGSTVYTFFKDKPTNFNLQVGLRLNLGQ